MKLFEIATQYESILSNTFDQETGVINEDALVKLDELTVTFEDKSIAVASYIKNLDAERKAIEEAKKAMAERESRLDRRVTYLTSYLQSNMERCGITEINCPYFAIKLKKCPVSVDVIDENSIPETYKKSKMLVSVDKVKLKEEMLAGVIVQGAALKQNMRLEIK